MEKYKVNSIFTGAKIHLNEVGVDKKWLRINKTYQQWCGDPALSKFPTEK